MAQTQLSRKAFARTPRGEPVRPWYSKFRGRSLRNEVTELTPVAIPRTPKKPSHGSFQRLAEQYGAPV